MEPTADKLKQYRLQDELSLPDGRVSWRGSIVFAGSKHAADVTARIHHWLILRQIGVL